MFKTIIMRHINSYYRDIDKSKCKFIEMFGV